MTLPKFTKSKRYGNLPWPATLTEDVILEGAKRAESTLDNVGFCIGCGAEAMECEPDARYYECDECERRLVFGASELMMTFVL